MISLHNKIQNIIIEVIINRNSSEEKNYCEYEKQFQDIQRTRKYIMRKRYKTPIRHTFLALLSIEKGLFQTLKLYLIEIVILFHTNIEEEKTHWRIC